MLFFLEGNYESAAEDFAVAVEFDKEQADLFYYHGLALYHIGELTEAIQAFNECTKSRSNRPEVLRIHAQVVSYFFLISSRFDDCICGLNLSFKMFSI